MSQQEREDTVDEENGRKAEVEPRDSDETTEATTITTHPTSPSTSTNDAHPTLSLTPSLSASSLSSKLNAGLIDIPRMH